MQKWAPSFQPSFRCYQLQNLIGVLFAAPVKDFRSLAEHRNEVVHTLDSRTRFANSLVNAHVCGSQVGDGYGSDLPDASHPDVPRLVDSGLNGENAGEIDVVDLAISTFDFAAHPQLPVFHGDGIHQ